MYSNVYNGFLNKCLGAPAGCSTTHTQRIWRSSEDCQVYMFDFLVLFILIRCQPFSFDIVELASIATLTKYISSLHIDWLHCFPCKYNISQQFNLPRSFSRLQHYTLRTYLKSCWVMYIQVYFLSHSFDSLGLMNRCIFRDIDFVLTHSDCTYSIVQLCTCLLEQVDAID